MATAELRQKRAPKQKPELLVGATTRMRPVSQADLPTIQSWDEDPAIIDLMGRRFSEMTAGEWFDSLSDGRCRAWVIETHGGRMIGELELAHINWRAGSAELRICIGEKDCWNCGYGTDAIRSALRYAFERLDLEEVYLRVFASNRRAVRVYERMGFRTEAHLPPSTRRGDPSPVLLMNLPRDRWMRMQAGADRVG
jgi:RimJ/RimL family protein N-acetyltransferase